MTDAAVIAPVFISYSRANKEFVARLIEDLQAQGINIWIDRQGLKPGTRNWEQALRDAISAASAVILVSSPESRQSNYVQDELSIAEMYRKRVYPVWASGSAWMDCIPMGMGKVQYVDMRGTAYEVGLQAIAATLLNRELTAPQPDAPRTDIPPDFSPNNPYKGLQAFTGKDRLYFFGRDALIDTLLAAVEKEATERFLAVVGPSGSGKSSVVMAGLLPALQDRHTDWVFLPRLVPGTHPLEALAVTLRQHVGGQVTNILADLQDPSARGLHRLTMQPGAQSSRRVILFVDQFEELFTQTVSAEERQQFIDALTTAVSEPEGTLTVITTLRADFSDRPMYYPDLARLFDAYTVPVLPMTLADLRDVIQKPAELPDVRLTYDDGLVAEIVFEVRDQIGALPLLQFTLDQLFQNRDGLRLTYAAYQRIGGVRGALARHAETTYARLPDDEHRRLTRTLFLLLVEPGPTEQDTTRRRASMRELVVADPAQTKIIQAVAEAFTRARLLVSSEADGTTTLEVSHEALIREWDRLREDWLNGARDDLRLRKTITVDTTEWLRRGAKIDDDGLYRGTVLITAQAWAQRNIPGADHVAFLKASAARQEREEQDRIEAQRRELELAQRAAEAERQAREAAQFRAVRARRAATAATILGGISTALFVAGLVTASNTSRQLRIAEDTLTPIPATLNAANTQVWEADAQAQIAKEQVRAANASLTPVPVTLTAIARDVKAGEALNQSLQMAAVAENVLQDNRDPQLAALLALRGLKATYSYPAEAALVKSLERLDAGTIFSGRVGTVNAVAFSPDGRLAVTAGEDRVVRIWDVSSGQEIRRFASVIGPTNTPGVRPTDATPVQVTATFVAQFTLTAVQRTVMAQTGHLNRVTAVTFSPDGRWVVSGSADQTIRIWEVESGQIYRIIQTPIRPVPLGAGELTPTPVPGAPGSIRSLAFSPDGRFLVSVGDDSTLRNSVVALWDAQSWTEIRRFVGHRGLVTSAAFSPDGRYIATGGQDTTLRLWSVDSGLQVRLPMEHDDQLTSVAFSPDGQTIATATREGTARLWSVQTGTLFRPRVIEHAGGINSIVFSPDGRFLLTAGADRVVRRTQLMGVAPSAATVIVATHGSDVTTAVFSPDGRSILTASRDNTIRIWNLDTGNISRRLSDRPGGGVVTGALSQYARRLAASPDGRYVASVDVSAGISTGVRIWDLVGKGVIRRLPTSASVVAFSPDGRLLATGGSEIRLVVLRGEDEGASARRFSPLAGSVSALAFSADGNYILSGGSGGSIQLWESSTGRELRRFRGHLLTATVTSLAFSPDGRQALSADSTGIIRLWDVATATVATATSTGEMRHGNVSVTGIAIAPDGRTALSGGRDNLVRLWDLATQQEIGQFVGHTDVVFSVAFSPDGRYALSASQDRTARLWDALTGRELRRLVGHSESVNDAVFLPDGRAMVTASSDGTLLLWETNMTDLITVACARLNRDFGTDERQLYRIPTQEVTCNLAEGTGPTRTPTAQPSWTAVATRTPRPYSSTPLVPTVPTERPTATDGPSPTVTASLTRTPTSTLRSSLTPSMTLAPFTAAAQLATHTPIASPTASMTWTPSRTFTPSFTPLPTSVFLRQLPRQSVAVGSLSISPDGRAMLVGSALSETERTDNNARLYDFSTGELLYTLSGHSNGVIAVAFSADGKFALTGSRDRTAQLWDLQARRSIQTFSGHTDWVSGVTFSRDGTQVLTAGKDGTIRLWNAQNGQEIRRYTGHTKWVNNAAFSSDGKLIISGSDDGTARLWDVETGDSRRVFSTNEGAVNFAALSPDGRFVAAAAVGSSTGSKIVIWDAVTGAPRYTLPAAAVPFSVVFSADGQRVLTAEQSLVRIWEPQTGQVTQTIRPGVGDIALIAYFTPDERNVVVGGRIGSVSIYEVGRQPTPASPVASPTGLPATVTSDVTITPFLPGAPPATTLPRTP